MRVSVCVCVCVCACVCVSVCAVCTCSESRTHNSSLNDCLCEVSLISINTVAGNASDG